MSCLRRRISGAIARIASSNAACGRLVVCLARVADWSVVMVDSTAQKLKSAIDAKGYSRLQLSKKSGVSYVTICRMLQNDRHGYLDTWLKIADTLNIDLGDLLNGRNV